MPDALVLTFIMSSKCCVCVMVHCSAAACIMQVIAEAADMFAFAAEITASTWVHA